MKVTTFCKFGVTIGAAALIVGAFAVPAAQADPTPAGSFGTLVGLGSDTTQDVMNGVATAIGGGQIASYDATNAGPSVVTRSGGIAIPRVSGSGAGRDELLVSIGQLANKSGVALADGTSTTVDSSVVGQLDFARSSGGPATNVQAADGVVAYIPFAQDAVDVAFAPGSPLAKIPFYIGTGKEDKTEPTLWNVYRGDVAYAYFNADGSYNSVGSSATGPDGTTVYKIQPLLPKYGSGTRSYFLGQLGLTDASGFTTTNPYVADTDNGQPIEEHNGQAVIDYTSGSTLAIAPFSVSQWVAQANGVGTVTDRRHGVVLASLGRSATGQTPATTGSGTSYATNPGYAGFVRDVYNIVPSSLADDPSSQIAKTFVGPNSLVCKQTATIEAYGFLPEPATSAATTCGYSQLRAFTASTSSTALTIAASATIGTAINATATVTSFGNGGGKVYFYQGQNVVGSGVVASGATTVTAPVTLTGTGSAQVTAQFVPALAGVGASVSSPSTVAVNAAQTVSSTSVKPGSFVIGKSSPSTITVANGDPAGGTVTLKSGNTVLGTAKLAAGATSAVISTYPHALTYGLVASYVPATSASTKSNSALVSVKVAKGSPSFSTSTPKTVSRKAHAVFSVAVAGLGTTPTGTVTVKEGSKVLVSKKGLNNGKALISVPLLADGTHKLTVIYSGSTLWNTATRTVTVKVVH
ncbi:Ig-like domain-containing protein [Frondihabitans australicus]|uniref:Ig-like domain-containing protein n=1 Tax=Frondihabitans australicus TaxID=386892 RepID=A0A495IAZ0_9MICO|nr:Ig-like domain repeat protein [Frondihabitans australicus]RKR73167.1 Ig-like domain-containing protein [Frondihabitans australicus]